MHPLRRVADVLDRQHGLVTRAQLAAAGIAPHEIERLVRRREAVLLGRGVLLTHTGEPTFPQRVWAAVLAIGDAAAAGRTVLDLESRRLVAADAPVHVAFDEKRRVAALPGVRLHRRSNLDTLVAWNLSPPRLRIEEALLDVAMSRERRVDGVAVLADAVGARRTTAARLRSALDRRARVRERGWWAGVIDDLADGTHSVLEHGYATRVERAHGLPRGARQVRHVEGGRVTFSDVEYIELGVRVELDGFATHGGRQQRERDLDRDLLVTLAGDRSIRLGWGHVFESECRTAGLVARILAASGWAGAPRECSPGCSVASTWAM